MEKTTVLARLRLTVAFSEETILWLSQFSNNSQNSKNWFARDDGTAFLSEFGSTWWNIFNATATSEINKFFLEIGVPQDSLPYIQRGESYRGSWIVDAVLLVAGTAGTAYTTLKTVSELPKIADGLAELKTRIVQKVKPELDEEIRETLTETVERSIAHSETSPSTVDEASEVKIIPPPISPVIIDLVIDARPLRSLTPSDSKSHKIHLSIAISRDTFVLENLGESSLEDLQIGLFKTRTQRRQWSFGDAYRGILPLLSAHQTITKHLSDFRENTGSAFDISNGDEVFVDCWIQDKSGIYLFQFFIEKS